MLCLEILKMNEEAVAGENVLCTWDSDSVIIMFASFHAVDLILSMNANSSK